MPKKVITILDNCYEAVKDPNQQLLEDLKNYVEEEDIKELEISYDNSFQIDNDYQASRLVKMYIRAKEEVDKIKNTAKEYLERENKKVEEWKDKHLSAPINTMTWTENLLKEYAKERIKNSKKKSISFVGANLQFSKSTSYNYDEEKLIDYLSSRDEMEEFLNVSVTPKKAELKKAGKFINGKLFINGKEIPGAEEVINEDKFSIKLT